MSSTPVCLKSRLRTKRVLLFGMDADGVSVSSLCCWLSILIPLHSLSERVKAVADRFLASHLQNGAMFRQQRQPDRQSGEASAWCFPDECALASRAGSLWLPAGLPETILPRLLLLPAAPRKG